MRRVLLIAAAAAVAALAAGGASAAVGKLIVFGTTGGNMVPYRIAIDPNGAVVVYGPMHVGRRRIGMATVRRLRREVESTRLRSRACPGTLPDVSSKFIRLGSRTWTVRGGCEKPFARVWSDLGKAVGLGSRGSG